MVLCYQERKLPQQLLYKIFTMNEKEAKWLRKTSNLVKGK